eukprot:TRINITY_DN27482_c0_g1_i1.p1 TRINITY_DN27482_c0_g1~~TRINITY_DN27482_c0_g1_i1.p1  ORF type:complete len:420 (-),score=74.78 TRINITY_DN27482_c0_g1_i1:46-1146(-)
MDMSPGEKVFVSLSDARKLDEEKFAAPGKPWQLKAVDSDAVLLLRAWAGADEASVRSDVRGRRELGVLRIPLRHLRELGLKILYQTWLTLDLPGLNGMGSALAEDRNYLNQKLVDGPRHLFQPKLCISLCRLEDLDKSERLVLTSDASHDAREAQWSALLRSQQQHVTMSTALHSYAAHANGYAHASPQQDRDSAARQIEDLTAEVRHRSQRLQELRRRLQQPQNGRAYAADTSEPHDFISQVHGQTMELQATNRGLQEELDGVRSDIEKVSEEANSKIDSANERIRALRGERDQALREGDRLRAEGAQLHARQEECRKERQLLADQKEALLRIVEDLHQTCVNAGMESVGRHSMKEIGETMVQLR